MLLASAAWRKTLFLPLPLHAAPAALARRRAAGIAISKKAGMVPLQMELGGKDVCIICADADLVSKGACEARSPPPPHLPTHTHMGTVRHHCQSANACAKRVQPRRPTANAICVSCAL